MAARTGRMATICTSASFAAPTGITFDGGLTTQTVGGATIAGIENISFVQGSNYDDTINGRSTGTGYSEFGALMGMGGNDTLLAGYYTGTLFGGDGNDIVDGRGSQYLQAVYGDDGDDTLYTNTNTFASAYGGNGNDTIYAHGTIDGGAGNDTINVQASYYPGQVHGGTGDDTIYAPQTQGHGGIYGDAGADTLYGGTGNDTLYSAGDATPGADQLDRGTDHDQVYGGGGDDTIYAGYGDTVDGGAGTNTLILTLTGSPSALTVNGNSILAGTARWRRDDQQYSADRTGSTGPLLASHHHADAIVTAEAHGDRQRHDTAGTSAVTLYGDAGNDMLTEAVSRTRCTAATATIRSTAARAATRCTVVSATTPISSMTPAITSTKTRARAPIRSSWFSFNLTDAPNVEKLILTGTANSNGTGGTGNDTITGNGAKTCCREVTATNARWRRGAGQPLWPGRR